MARFEPAGFTTIRFEGSLFFPDFLRTLVERAFDGTNHGTRANDYHYDGEQLNEVISQSWTQCCQRWNRCHSTPVRSHRTR